MATTKTREGKGILHAEIRRKRVPKDELMLASRQLAAFIRAGVPVLQALIVIEEETNNSTLRAAWASIGEALRRGDTFADAVAVHETIFPPFYVGMVRSAELTGRLDTVLDQLAEYIERDLEVRRQVRSALAYPLVIFAMAVVTVIVLTTFVLPRFERFFESLDARLPLPTRMLLAVSGFVGRRWLLLLVGAATLGLLTWLVLKTERGRELRDVLMLRVPYVRQLVVASATERFARMLAYMTAAGVPLTQGLLTAARGTNNRVYEKRLVPVRQALLRGEGLAAPIAQTKLFPTLLAQIVRVGEDTASLAEQLETAAGFFEQELLYRLKRFTVLFEPAVIVLMGAMVGFVALAVVSAMYGIFQQAGRLR